MTAMKPENNVEDILEDIHYLLESDQLDFLRNILADMHVADISDLVESLDADSRYKVFSLISQDSASDVLADLEDVAKEDILEELDSSEIAELVSEMDSDDAVDIVSELDSHIANEVLDKVDEEAIEDIRELLKYPEDTAGGIMAKEYVSIEVNWTVQQAIEQLRKASERVDDIYLCYVVDRFGLLLGTVSLKELILAEEATPIHSIVDEEIFAVTADTDQEEVAQLFEKYDLISSPVIDSEKRLIGRITIDDILDVINEEADEDLARIAGIGEEEILEDSSLRIVQARLPWLLISFVGEIISALVMQMYSMTIQQVLASAFFIPVVMAMGGSIGQQSGIIVVRGLATGEINPRDIWRRVSRETRSALISGSVIAALIFCVVMLWQKDINLASVLAGTLLIVMLNASMFGAIIPFVFKRFNIDPAIASGPFVTTFNDVIGLLIYFGLLTLAITSGMIT
ncbi:MAG: magnesium transporter [Calditrichia bacterium]